MFIPTAIDAGNDSLKALFNGFENKLYIPNVVKEMEFRQVIELGDDPLKELHIHITSSALQKSGTYAVGAAGLGREVTDSLRPPTFTRMTSSTFINARVLSGEMPLTRGRVLDECVCHGQVVDDAG